jgi:hypothetical protein
MAHRRPLADVELVLFGEPLPVASNEHDTEKFGFFAFTLFS